MSTAESRAYHRAVHRSPVRIPCPVCGESLPPRGYASHFRDRHDHPRHACVWCLGEVSWSRGLTPRFASHRLECFRAFVRRHAIPVVPSPPAEVPPPPPPPPPQPAEVPAPSPSSERETVSSEEEEEPFRSSDDDDEWYLLPLYEYLALPPRPPFAISPTLHPEPRYRPYLVPRDPLHDRLRRRILRRRILRLHRDGDEGFDDDDDDDDVDRGREHLAIFAMSDFRIDDDETVLRRLSECSVCLEAFERSETVKRLACEHLFHETCIRRWLERTPTCPNCRVGVAAIRTRRGKEEEG